MYSIRYQDVSAISLPWHRFSVYVSWTKMSFSPNKVRIDRAGPEDPNAEWAIVPSSSLENTEDM